jgi:hypothetical protein
MVNRKTWQFTYKEKSEISWRSEHDRSLRMTIEILGSCIATSMIAITMMRPVGLQRVLLQVMTICST